MDCLLGLPAESWGVRSNGAEHTQDTKQVHHPPAKKSAALVVATHYFVYGWESDGRRPSIFFCFEMDCLGHGVGESRELTHPPTHPPTVSDIRRQTDTPSPKERSPSQCLMTKVAPLKSSTPERGPLMIYIKYWYKRVLSPAEKVDNPCLTSQKEQFGPLRDRVKWNVIGTPTHTPKAPPPAGNTTRRQQPFLTRYQK